MNKHFPFEYKIYLKLKEKEETFKRNQSQNNK